MTIHPAGVSLQPAKGFKMEALLQPAWASIQVAQRGHRYSQQKVFRWRHCCCDSQHSNILRRHARVCRRPGLNTCLSAGHMDRGTTPPRVLLAPDPVEAASCRHCTERTETPPPQGWLHACQGPTCRGRPGAGAGGGGVGGAMGHGGRGSGGSGSSNHIASSSKAQSGGATMASGPLTAWPTMMIPSESESDSS